MSANGNEPTPETYRNRRIAALGILLLLVILLIWGIVSLFRALGGSDNENANATASTSATAEPFSDFSERPSESASAEASESAEAESTDEAGESEEATASESAAEEETAEPTAEASEDPEASPSAEAAPSEEAVVACSAADLNVSLTVDQGSYAAGQNPAMAITYTNTSGKPCNIGGEGQKVDVNITSGAAQVYNYAQCNATEEQVAELAAGETASKAVSWNRSLNVLGCDTSSTIKPGYYWATATVNGVSSQPTRIIVTG